MNRTKCLHIRFIMFIILVTFVAVLSIVVVKAKQQARIDELQKGIADEIIRFHIRANSDSEEDQQLKLLVKERVVEYVKPLLSQSKGIDESRRILTEESDNIRKIALDTIEEEGYNYDVAVYFEESYFPMKMYGDLSFPPGEYEAFRIDIGESAGKNWWCVLYPPLCFVDSVYAEVPEESRKQLEECLSADEYDVVTGNENLEFSFKYLTFLNGIFE
ncbi:MAG: stage II sporulation protein R [Lachnospira sp.]